MKRTPTLFLLCATFLLGTFAEAQNCDPWISKAYNQLYGRGPSATECNIKNYNSGSWNSYAELVGYIAGHNRNKPGNFLKGDPWIFQAYTELYNRTPTAWELNTQNYNNGSWNNYGDLKGYVQQYHKSLNQNGIKVLTGSLNGNTAVVFTDKNSAPLAIDLVSMNNGKVVAAGGANVVAAGGANVVAAGGLNLTISPNLAGVTFGSDRTIQSTGTRVVSTAGKTKLVIR